MVNDPPWLAPHNCSLCPRLCKSRRAVVNGYGSMDADIMCVAQNPGKQEEDHGRPLWPKAWTGSRLIWCAHIAGLPPVKDWRLENVVRCRPPRKADRSGDDVPTGVEVKACADYLQAAISEVNPKLIITLGARALKWFFPNERLDRVHGKPMLWKFNREVTPVSWETTEYIIVPMYHPAAIAPGRKAADVNKLIADWNSLGHLYRRLIANDWQLSNEAVGDYKLVSGPEIRAYLEGAKEFAFDFESDNNWWEYPDGSGRSFKPRRATPVGFSVARGVGEALYTTDSIECIRDLLEDPTIIKVAHNAQYEYILCKQQGIELTNFDCTKTMAYVLRKPETGLKGLTWTELGIQQTTFDEVDWNDPESYVPYGSADSDFTLRHFYNLCDELKAEGLWEFYLEVERGVVAPLGRLHLRGIPMDADKLIKFGKELETELETCATDLSEIYPYEINWNSTHQKRNVLYGPDYTRVKQVGELKGRIKHTDGCNGKLKLVECDCHGGVRTGALSRIDYVPPGFGLKSIFRQESTAASTGIPALREIRRGLADIAVLSDSESKANQICEVLEYRATIVKCLGDNVRGVLNQVEEDGRIHPVFVQAGEFEEKDSESGNIEAPETGRLAGRDPNPMNRLHHGDTERPYMLEWAKRVRSAYVAPLGWTWVKVDVSKEEPNIAALVSGDIRYYNDLQGTGDIYKTAAGIAFNIPPESVDTEQRQIGKRMAMAWLNRARGYGIRKSAHWMTDAEASKFCVDMDKYYSRLTAWHQDELIPFLYRHGCVYTYFGRKCTLNKIFCGPTPNQQLHGWPKTKEQREAERESVPMNVQGTAADVLKIALQRVEAQLDEEWAYIIIPVHDEFDLLVRDDKVVWVVEEVLMHMLDGILPIPLKVEVETGPNWAETKVWRSNG